MADTKWDPIRIVQSDSGDQIFVGDVELTDLVFVQSVSILMDGAMHPCIQLKITAAGGLIVEPEKPYNGE